MEVRVKYETPDHHGETRRDRNERFGWDPGPEIEVPECAEYIWNWFWDIVSPTSHIVNDEPITLTHFELMAWRDNMQIDATPFEIDCLINMSRAWSRKMADELSIMRNKQAEESKKKNG